MRTTKKSKTNVHYVSNKGFYSAMVLWKEKKELALNRGEPLPPMNTYIADCIYRIATRLSYRPNFINYSFKEDMIGDGLENCIRYVDRFNPEKSDNPFAYFTRIAYNAYIRRIKKEKKQSEIRKKMTQEVRLFSNAELKKDK